MTIAVIQLPGRSSMLDRTFDVLASCECGHDFVGRSINTDPDAHSYGEPTIFEVRCPECSLRQEIDDLPRASHFEEIAATSLGWKGRVIA